MRASCVPVISGSSTETTDGEILVAFSAQTWPQKRSQPMPDFKNFPGGACPQNPLACSHLCARNGRTSLK